MWDSWRGGLYEGYRDMAEETVRDDSVELHPYVAHILSSQAFTFNLFLPFRNGVKEGLARKVSDLVGEEVTIGSGGLRVGASGSPPR